MPHTKTDLAKQLFISEYGEPTKQQVIDAKYINSGVLVSRKHARNGTVIFDKANEVIQSRFYKKGIQYDNMNCSKKLGTYDETD